MERRYLRCMSRVEWRPFGRGHDRPGFAAVAREEIGGLRSREEPLRVFVVAVGKGPNQPLTWDAVDVGSCGDLPLPCRSRMRRAHPKCRYVFPCSMRTKGSHRR
jgi:hypothetical protein